MKKAIIQFMLKTILTGMASSKNILPDDWSDKVQYGFNIYFTILFSCIPFYILVILNEKYHINEYLWYSISFIFTFIMFYLASKQYFVKEKYIRAMHPGLNYKKSYLGTSFSIFAVLLYTFISVFGMIYLTKLLLWITRFLI